MANEPIGSRKSKAVTTHVCLLDGTPDGIVIVENPNWHAQVCVVPRRRLQDFIARMDLQGTSGIVVLMAAGRVQLVTECENLADTLGGSGIPDDCNQVVIITNKHHQFTRNERRWLTGDTTAEEPTEAKLAELKEFAQHAKTLMGCLGILGRTVPLRDETT